MGLIDRMDLLSGCGGLQGAEQQARARDTVSLSAIGTFVTAPLVERTELFLTGYNCSSPLIYHTEELNVDTSKYFHTQGPRGHVFSPCLEWKEPIHHWLFVTETETTVHTCVFSECASIIVCIYALITHVYSTCVNMRV